MSANTSANTSGAVELVPVLANHRFDEAALGRYLNGKLAGFEGAFTVRQFQGGQSNPTFHIQAGDHAYVLRKKPPGKLLPSAHAVDREYAVIRALQGSAVPVPKVHLLCTDESVIGQMFYVMDHVPGRVFNDRLLPGCAPAERMAMNHDLIKVLAALHAVDPRAVGLGEFGRAEGYVGRQVARWSKQYEASKVDEVPSMDKLAAWLPANDPKQDQTVIIHGDYRPGNVIFAPNAPKVAAVLDWELSTLGHPFPDLAYYCLPYRIPRGGISQGLLGMDLAAHGFPSEPDIVAAYCRARGIAEIPHWDYYIVFSLFRLSAIMAGVYRRGLDGNASDARALERGVAFKKLADLAWEIASKVKPLAG